VCRQAGVLYTIRYYQPTGECLNKVTGPAYAQAAIIEEPENDEAEEQAVRCSETVPFRFSVVAYRSLLSD
jgi:hypothetical protein